MAEALPSPGWYARLRHTLSRPVWGADDALTAHWRSSVSLLGPIGAAIGGFGGLIAGAQAGAAGAIMLAPWTALGGWAVMRSVAAVETVLRSRRLLSGGSLTGLSLLSLEALGGGIIGGALALIGGGDVAGMFGATATIVAGAGWARRILQARWIDDTVLALSGHAHTGRVEDYSLEYDLIAAGEIERAEELFVERSEANEDDPAPLIEAAQTFQRRGRPIEAVRMYARAVGLDGVDAARASAITRQIWSLHRGVLADPEAGVEHLEILVGLHPDSPEVEWAWQELTIGESVASPRSDALGARSSRVPAVRAVEEILADAFEARASDIHLEDYAEGLRVRYRVDGLLQDAPARPRRLRAAILARVRVMAGLNPSENPRPQDARIRINWGGRDVDVRVSTVPTLYGESVALRILDTERGRLELEDLGFREEDVERLRPLLARPNGMILTTGPGGAGKSTTLHAIVRKLSTGREKIFTVEDPVEYALEGVNQVSVNERAGLTFANLLRSLVRQDPDVLLVGEIRDSETAELATHAALTGHMVLSTMHTTDALSALHRLVDIGLPPYMVVHTLGAVIAQRLVRRVCDGCAQERPSTSAEDHALGVVLGTVRVGTGCEACRDTGYLGRIGVFEFLSMTDEVGKAFLEQVSPARLREIAREQGIRSLKDDAIGKVRAGLTTPDEVIRITASESMPAANLEPESSPSAS